MIPFNEFISEQRRDLSVCITNETCSGATYIVTGANLGLGYETAKHLLRAGSKRVIMVVRNVKAGNTAKAEIEAATNMHNVL